MTHVGLELLFESVKSSFKNNTDVIVCLVHWNLTSNHYKCVGVGEKIPGKNDQVTKSERLPSGWNDSQDIYTMMYVSADGKYHTLKIVKMDNTLLIHLMRNSDEKIASTNLRIEQYTTGNFSTYTEAFKDIEIFNKQMMKEVISEMKSDQPAARGQASSSRSENRSANQQTGREDPLRVPPRRPPVTTGPPDWEDPGGRYPQVGRGDLDPLGAGHGGMFMDPMRGGMRGRFPPDPSAGIPGRLPRGAVPPGARFDPFGPPGTAPGPDPDHMRPPGYDDMFM